MLLLARYARSAAIINSLVSCYKNPSGLVSKFKMCNKYFAAKIQIVRQFQNAQGKVFQEKSFLGNYKDVQGKFYTVRLH